MKLPAMGKVPPYVFRKLILPHLGAPDKNIVVGPRHGVDCGVVAVEGTDKVLVIETDPFYIARELGMKLASWFAVHILASDVAVMGARPKYLAVDLNLPLETRERELEEMWLAVHSECKRLGISIVSGHTARYPGCNYPMVGGAVMIGITTRDKFITPGGARIGDDIIITKGAAIEATALLATFFEKKVRAKLGDEIAQKAKALAWKMSVVEEALTAIDAGGRGIHSMHDATECGVYGALYEVASASGVGMVVEKEKIMVRDEVRRVCEFFKIDPYISISEGTLLITCAPEKTDEILRALKKKKIDASRVGKVVEKKRGMRLVVGRRETRLTHPREDPFWRACSGKTIE
ncbi:MAG: AIR synthase family protein [Candidatus Micrarchaeota archaeon]